MTREARRRQIEPLQQDSVTFMAFAKMVSYACTRDPPANYRDIRASHNILPIYSEFLFSENL